MKVRFKMSGIISKIRSMGKIEDFRANPFENNGNIRLKDTSSPRKWHSPAPMQEKEQH